jgi:hypothetical protein
MFYDEAVVQAPAYMVTVLQVPNTDLIYPDCLCLGFIRKARLHEVALLSV